MSTWLSEREFDRDGAAAVGMIINVAFLREIKSDFGFRDLLNQVYYRFKPKTPGEPLPQPRVASQLISDLRDELETYFALEEFYGYFSEAAVNNPCVDQKAVALREQHKTLFLQLSEVVELAEQITYHEVGPDFTIADVADALEQFCMCLADHEQDEMELMMRMCNEDIGVGD